MVTYAWEWRTLVLIIITLFRYCKFQNISNKQCQCRNTDFWVGCYGRGLLVHQQWHRSSGSNEKRRYEIYCAHRVSGITFISRALGMDIDFSFNKLHVHYLGTVHFKQQNTCNKPRQCRSTAYCMREALWD
jgi:hypothetical protein